MHVLIAVLHRPDKPTGVCRYAANLARCLAETSEIMQITLVTGAWQKSYFENAFLLKSEKIKILGVDIKNSSFSRNLWFLFGLPKLARSVCPDLVHLSFPLPFIRKFFPCPVVSTIHDLYPYQFPENFGYKQVLFNRLFFQQCINQSDALTCVSKTTLSDLTSHFPKVTSGTSKTEVIYNFVDFEGINARFPASLPEGEPSFILCVGQHRKNKNIDLLIKAYAELRNENKLTGSLKLVIVGGLGPETDYLNQLVDELFLENSVYFLSAIDDSELCWLYQNCSLFVIPSSLEGFCIPLVEALYFSCKVVCSDIPIFKEIGSEDCLYFSLSERPIDSLMESIYSALTSEGKTQKVDSKRFTAKNVSRECLDFYAGLM